MKPAAARALEFLIGAAPGATAGGATGAATYEPEDEQFWRDHTGQVQGRRLTRDERKQRLRRILAGAALGAAVGGGGTVAGGRGRETLLRRYDAEDTRRLADLARAPHEAAASPTSGVSYLPARQVLEDIERARATALDMARTERAGRVFGGPQQVRYPGGGTGPHPETTARGQFHRLMRERGGMPKTAEMAKLALSLGSLMKPMKKAPMPKVKVQLQAPKPPKAGVTSGGSTFMRPIPTQKVVASSPTGAMKQVP